MAAVLDSNEDFVDGVGFGNGLNGLERVLVASVLVRNSRRLMQSSERIPDFVACENTEFQDLSTS